MSVTDSSTARRRRGQTARDASGTPGGGPAPSRRRWWSRSTFDASILPWLLLLPALVLIGGLIGYPVLRTAWLSFTDADLRGLMTGEIEFIGLGNYVEALTDPHFRRVTYTTIVFGLACVAATMVLGIATALLLNRRFAGRAVLAVLVLLPWAMPRLAASTVWQWLFHDQYGIVNWTLTNLGLSGFEGYAWFNQRLTAFIAIGVVVVWQSFPFVAISLLAGLQTVSEEVLEAAQLDGAGPWQRLRHVTLPILKPLLLVLVVISTIWNFKVFDQVFMMTEGGPARSTEVITLTVWREAFVGFEFGTASALAMILFAVLVIVTIVYVRLIREDQEL